MHVLSVVGASVLKPSRQRSHSYTLLAKRPDNMMRQETSVANVSLESSRVAFGPRDVLLKHWHLREGGRQVMSPPAGRV